MKKITSRALVSVLLSVVALVPALVAAHDGEDHSLAQVNTSATTNVGVHAAGASVRARITASTTAETARYERAKDKAAQEIDRRVKALNALKARAASMIKVTDTLKANLNSNIDMEINAFVALKAKIEADTDPATLKEDIKSITQSYRVFALVIPQGRIAAAADRLATIINMMIGTGTKLQARIQTAKNAGQDTAALEAALVDLGAKLSSAQTHAQGSLTLSAPLAPDNGDKDAMAKNNKALADAHAELEAARKDIVAGRKAIETIVKGLKTLSVSATSTLEAQ